MNKQEFIKGIMDLYPDVYRQERKSHYLSWFKLYETAIGNNWDYDKLMRIFAREYKSVTTPPHPSWFRDYKNDVIIKTEQPKEEILMTNEELIACEKAKDKFFKEMDKLSLKMRAFAGD